MYTFSPSRKAVHQRTVLRQLEARRSLSQSPSPQQRDELVYQDPAEHAAQAAVALQLDLAARTASKSRMLNYKFYTNEYVHVCMAHTPAHSLSPAPPLWRAPLARSLTLKFLDGCMIEQITTRCGCVAVQVPCAADGRDGRPRARRLVG